MENVKRYKIGMKLKGKMTQIPDSQKLFGALIYLYKEYMTDEKATELVDNIKNRNIYCSLSNLMPLHYFPTPKSYLMEEMSIKENKREETIRNKKDTYKKIKQRDFITQKDFWKVIKKPEEIKKVKSFIQLYETQQIHASIDSLSYHLPGLNPNLYSIPEVGAMEVKSETKNVHETFIRDFYFYLSIEEGIWERELIQTLKNAEKNKRIFFLGARGSSGLNLFSIKNISLEDRSNDASSNYFLNLGMLLPDEINMKQSYMNYFSSERRPYHRKDGWDERQTRKFISYIAAGSILYTENEVSQMGKCISTGYDDYSIVFGNAMPYPIPSISFSGGR